MHNIKFVHVFSLILFLFFSHLSADDFKSSFGGGMGMNLGTFHLEEKGGTQLLHDRDVNSTGDADLYGLSLILSYRYSANIEIMGEANRTWGGESLGDSYGVNTNQLTALYIHDVGFYGGLGYTSLKLDGLSVNDPEDGWREYDYNGSGLHWDLGYEAYLSQISFCLGYRSNMLFSFNPDEGQTEFNETPSVSRWYFNFKFWLG